MCYCLYHGAGVSARTAEGKEAVRTDRGAGLLVKEAGSRRTSRYDWEVTGNCVGRFVWVGGWVDGWVGGRLRWVNGWVSMCVRKR